MRPLFRPALPSDQDEILLLMRELQEYSGDPFNQATARPALKLLLQNQDFGLAWLIEVEGQTVGYVVLTLGFSLEFGGRDAFIDELYLRADYRGQRIGTETLRFLEEVCRSLEVCALHLEVDRCNEAGKRLYLHNGFQERGNYHLMTRRLNKQAAIDTSIETG